MRCPVREATSFATSWNAGLGEVDAQPSATDKEIAASGGAAAARPRGVTAGSLFY
jgi:hypothetical protein